MSLRRGYLPAVAASTVGVLFSALIHSPWASPSLYSDIASFWGRDWLFAGTVPYVSSFFEYPPLDGVMLYVARVIGGDYNGYYLAFSAFSLVAAAGLGWSCWRLARSLGREVNPLYFFLPSIVVYGVYNFDLFNALFIVLSLQSFVEKRRDWSAAFLGVAFATKLVAVFLIPILLMETKGWRERARYLAVAALVAAAAFIPIAVFNFGYFSQFLSFYSNWGLEDAWYLWVFGDPFSSVAKVFGYALMAVLLLRVYTLKMPTVQKSFLALTAYLISTPVYAPQFNVMLIPLVAVLALSSPFLFGWEAFNAMIILTWFSVPATATSGPTYPWTLPQTMALFRTVSLALLGLGVAAANGHSLVNWFKSRLGPQRSLDGFAEEPQAGSPLQNA